MCSAFRSLPVVRELFKLHQEIIGRNPKLVGFSGPGRVQGLLRVLNTLKGLRFRV